MTLVTPQGYRREGYRNPVPTTDAIIEHHDGRKEGIVLITRKNPPHGLAIPGGFAEWGLSLEDNVRKEAKEETGLELVLGNDGKPLCVRSNPDRDPRGHMISITYVGRGYGKLEAGDDAARAQLYTIPEIVELVQDGALVFDHTEILKEYLRWKGVRYD